MQILKRQCQTPDQQAKTISAANAAAKALWTFLDGVTEKYLTVVSDTAYARI
jgi:hypothetical protein